MVPAGFALAGPIAPPRHPNWYLITGGVLALLGIIGCFIPALIDIESSHG